MEGLSKDNISSATSKKNMDKFNTRTEHKCVTKTLFSSLDIQSAYYSNLPDMFNYHLASQHFPNLNCKLYKETIYIDAIT